MSIFSATPESDIAETFVEVAARRSRATPSPVVDVGLDVDLDLDLADLDAMPDLADADVAAEVDALDQLWTQDWLVDEERAYAPQRIDRSTLPSHDRRAEIARRGLDVVVSLVALLLLLPLMVALAIAVKVTSKGPALFGQLRPGKDGHEFRMLKFRSMVDGADRAVVADEATRRKFEQSDFKLDGDDPRITGLGRFIRRTSLDELPQLINVLRGDMSIVGIRPLLPRQLEQRPVRDQMLFKLMRPGMTGLWQVEGRSDIAGDERVALDRRYVEQWSLTNDLKILARTPLAVISSSGAR